MASKRIVGILSESPWAGYYRERRQEVLALAARCQDDELLRLAERYGKLIERAQIPTVVEITFRPAGGEV